MKIVLVALSIGLAVGAALIAIDLKSSLDSAETERDFFRARTEECFARCGP